MTIYAQAAAAMTELREEVSSIETRIPSPNTCLRILTDLCDLHMKMAEQSSKFYDDWQHAELQRKRKEGGLYEDFREDQTVADANRKAFAAAGDEYDKEVQAEETYKRLQRFMKSTEHAIDCARSVVSFIKTAETSHTS